MNRVRVFVSHHNKLIISIVNRLKKKRLQAYGVHRFSPRGKYVPVHAAIYRAQQAAESFRTHALIHSLTTTTTTIHPTALSTTTVRRTLAIAPRCQPPVSSSESVTDCARVVAIVVFYLGDPADHNRLDS